MSDARGPQSPESMIRWPPKYDPSRTSVHVTNSIDIGAPPDRVWAWLIDAVRWPDWYPNASDVRLQGASRVLGPDVPFRWKTFGVHLSSKVEEFVPPERLAWSARAAGIDVYHAWLISATPSGSHVLTEESQLGWAARLSHSLRPSRMHEGHQQWLENLRQRAVSGPPQGTD